MVVYGPLVEVTLGPPEAEMTAVTAAGGIPKTITHNLLVDTGAQATCVEGKIPQALGLVPMRFVQMMGVSGKPEDYPVYRMSIILGMREDHTGASSRALFSADVVGTPSPPMPLNHIGLLGRDFLKYVRLLYDGPKGEFEIIDYKHVSAPHRAVQKPPPLGGWSAISRARKKGHRKQGK